MTCRVKVHGDPRARLKSQGEQYIYCVLHAHQLAAIMRGERGTGAMVSRSSDGQVIVPVLRLNGIVPVRGSGRKRGSVSKGGLAALDMLVEHVKNGHPGYLAVDGPAGPRGRVHKGASVLSIKTGAPALPMIAVPNRRWVASRAWDRLQMPLPFSTIEVYFGDPLYPQADESSEHYRWRIEQALFQLESRWDPQEAAYSAGSLEPLSEKGNDKGIAVGSEQAA